MSVYDRSIIIFYRIKLEVYELANIKSAKKRILVNRTKAARNKKQSNLQLKLL